MIQISTSKTADTRTCSSKEVSKDILVKSTIQHKGDVTKGLHFFREMLDQAAFSHDFDKLTNIDQFHSDFLTNFESTVWYDEHKKINRHHLATPDGVPEDVNLVDVLEMITDCVVAGMARSGYVYDVEISPEVLMKAFKNTATLLMNNIEIKNG